MNSRARVVRVTSKRVGLPQSVQRHRVNDVGLGTGTQGSLREHRSKIPVVIAVVIAVRPAPNPDAGNLHDDHHDDHEEAGTR